MARRSQSRVWTLQLNSVFLIHLSATKQFVVLETSHSNIFLLYSFNWTSLSLKYRCDPPGAASQSTIASARTDVGAKLAAASSPLEVERSDDGRRNGGAGLDDDDDEIMIRETVYQ